MPRTPDNSPGSPGTETEAAKLKEKLAAFKQQVEKTLLAKLNDDNSHLGLYSANTWLKGNSNLSEALAEARRKLEVANEHPVIHKDNIISINEDVLQQAYVRSIVDKVGVQEFVEVTLGLEIPQELYPYLETEIRPILLMTISSTRTVKAPPKNV